MRSKSEPVITKCNKSENWTKVTFRPDLNKFNMIELEDDVVALMSKRVFDIAGCLGKTVKVELNGKRIPVNSFTDYVNLYLNAAPRFVIWLLLQLCIGGEHILIFFEFFQDG